VEEKGAEMDAHAARRPPRSLQENPHTHKMNPLSPLWNRARIAIALGAVLAIVVATQILANRK
jgi:hypothetical protein